MIEVLVTMLIVTVGLMGLVGLQARATVAEFESYQRSQAIILAYSMVERMRMNHANMGSFKSLTSKATGTPYYGTAGANSATVNCAATDRASIDLCAWHSELLGASETKGGTSIGAVVDGRGCITYDETTVLPGAPDTGVFTVTVVWKGSTGTVAPTENCANGLYGSETMRRAVSVKFRFAKLS
jgi:type IV pilus assembly protein PilV